MTDAASVRIVAGNPWRVEVTHADGRVDSGVVFDDDGDVDGIVRAYRDPAAPPELHDIQAAVRRLGYFIDGFDRLPDAIREGRDLPLRPVWPHQAEHRLVEEPREVVAAFASGKGGLVVSVPAAGFADLLRDVEDATRYCFDPAGVERLTGLARRMAEAGPVAVVLPAEEADLIAYELRRSPLRGIRDESAGRMTQLARLIEEGRVDRGAVHEVLATALREALADGPAARDALLDELTRFVALHRDAVQPDL